MAPTSFSAESRSSFPVVRRRRDCTTMYSLVVLLFCSLRRIFRRGVDPFSRSIVRLEYLYLCSSLLAPPPLSLSLLSFLSDSLSTVSTSSMRIIYIRQYSWNREIKVRIGDSTRFRYVSGVGHRR